MILKGIQATAVLLVLILSNSATVQAQLFLKDSISVSRGKDVKVDDLGNIYVVDKSQALYIYRVSGQEFSFNAKSLGQIGNIDVSNPLKILVHYPSTGQLLVLDNNLVEIGRISLEKWQIFGTNVCIAASKLNGFWLYNPMDRSMLRFDFNGNRQVENLIGKWLGDAYPTYLFERDGLLYASLSDGRIASFDRNGRWIETVIGLKSGVKNFQINHGWIYFIQTDSIIFLHLVSLQQKKLPLPSEFISEGKKVKIFCFGDQVYFLRPKQVLIYKIKT